MNKINYYLLSYKFIFLHSKENFQKAHVHTYNSQIILVNNHNDHNYLTIEHQFDKHITYLTNYNISLILIHNKYKVLFI
jgi:hypothetical protein